MKRKLVSRSAAVGAAAVLLVCALAACAPQPSSGGNSDATDNAPTNEAVALGWSPDTDCAICHAAEANSREGGPSTASFHSETPCVECHDDAEALEKRHEGATSEDKMPSKLSKTEVDQSACLDCHNSYDELATKTADYAGLADSNGTQANPHALPDVAEHGEIQCANCHKMHGDKPAAETAKQECLSCHHADVFECGTCH